MIGNTLRHVTHVGTVGSDDLLFLPMPVSSRAKALPLPLSLFRAPSSTALVFCCLDVEIDADTGKEATEPLRNAGRPRSTRSTSPAATALPLPRDADRVERTGALALSATE